MNKNNCLYFIGISLVILTAFFLACWKIRQPGLYYDEMLFVNAAVGGKTDDFIALKVWGIPVLLMDYIGALKAWFYYPIFSIFHVTYWSVRFPAICFGIAGGVALVAALWRGFGKNSAITGSIMILLDPTLLTHSRLDWGPNALMFFFRGILLFSVVSCIQTKKIKWAWIALAAAFLGLFDKLNFIWFACAIVGAVAVAYYYQLKNNHLLKTQKAKPIIIVGSVIILATIIRAITVAQQISISWPDRITGACSLLRFTLCGGGALNFIAGNGLRIEHWFWPGYLIVFIAAVSSIKYLFKQKEQQRLFTFLGVTLLLVTGAFILTKSATGPHHSSMISGLWQMVVAPIVGAALDNRQPGLDSLARFFVKIGLAVIFIGSCIANIICINAFAKPTNSNWDTANTTAASFAQQHPGAYFISTDWGMSTQIIGLTNGRSEISDAWPSFATPGSAVTTITTMKRDKDTYIYTQLPQFEVFKNNRANLFAALQKDSVDYQIVQTYANVSGQPMIQLLLIPAKK
ncbi:MAG TPA: glycosyltransferase family 39 protein [Ferruginibacter sp.]|nr:glycosyltransferase family 39 protein [Ferruginibacter sp.]